MILEKENKIWQAILGLTFKHNTLAIDSQTWEELPFHNPHKGETRQGEIEKWREKILIVYGIRSIYDPKIGFWYFEHKDRQTYIEGLKALKETINE